MPNSKALSYGWAVATGHRRKIGGHRENDGRKPSRINFNKNASLSFTELIIFIYYISSVTRPATVGSKQDNQVKSLGQRLMLIYREYVIMRKLSVLYDASTDRLEIEMEVAISSVHPEGWIRKRVV